MIREDSDPSIEGTPGAQSITLHTRFEFNNVIRQIGRRYLLTPCLEPPWSVNSDDYPGPVAYPPHYIVSQDLENH